MSPEDIAKLASHIGPLPLEYRAFLARYPDAWRRPMFERTVPLAMRVPDDVERLVALNEAAATSIRRTFVVIGGNGVGDPYLVKRDGEPGVFIGEHETGDERILLVERTLSRFVAAHEGEHLDSLCERCVTEGLTEDALRLADAAVAAWKRYGKGERATNAHAHALL